MSSHATTADHHADDHGHHHELPAGHFHHFEPEQAYHAAKFGMWLFLATEVLFFGGLFAAFAVFHSKYFELFHSSSKLLNWKLGALNTVVLLFSSFSMALGVDAAQHGNNKKVVKCLAITIICAAIFMVVKYIEYTGKFQHGIFPGTNLFFALYFCLTGLHGIHVLVGIGIIFWVMRLAQKNRFSETYYTPCEVVGLYWHLVDLVWIYLFPLLYLIG
jgi:cytochrome c oxidase subunit 3